MLTKTMLQKFFYAAFCAMMAAIYALTGYTPADGKTQITVSEPEQVQAVFALVADPQISNYMLERYPVFESACQDLHNAQCDIDAIIGVGDITENGFAQEYQLVLDGLSGIDTEYIMASGNHDIRLRPYCQSVASFCDFTNALNADKAVRGLSYSKTVAGYKIIVLGSDKMMLETAHLSDEQLEWLDDELSALEGEPAFVVCHQPLKDTHNIENAWGSIIGGGDVGEQSFALKSVLSKYENVFLISGHLHSGFGPDSYNNVEGIHSINVPSVAIENKDGTYNNAGTGYVVELYEDRVVFRARDFAQGLWVSELMQDSSYDIVIPLE